VRHAHEARELFSHSVNEHVINDVSTGLVAVIAINYNEKTTNENQREKSRGGKTANRQWKLFYYKDAVGGVGRRRFSCLNGTQQVGKCKLLRANARG
jgi:hypothetical protein